MKRILVIIDPSGSLQLPEERLRKKMGLQSASIELPDAAGNAELVNVADRLSRLLLQTLEEKTDG